MALSRLPICRRSLRAALASSMLLVGVMVGLTQRPAAAAVTSVKAEACTYMVNVGLFGGPQTVNGCGEASSTSGTGLAARQPAGGTNLNPTDTSYSPHVRVTGSGGTMTATDSNGASGIYGPATIHGGMWPCEPPGEDPNNDGYPGNCPNPAPPSGPQEAHATGNATLGTVSASADIDLYATPIVVGCYTGYGPTCVNYGGYGPFPVQGETMHVECSATQTSRTGSTTLTNSTVAHSTDGEGSPLDEEVIPDNPPVNYTEHGVITNVGDVFTVVYNQHVYNADGSLTVNGMHMYLYGPTAIGEVIRGSVTCGTNPGPAAPADTLAPTCGTTVVAPVGPEDPTPQVPRKELIGVFDAGIPAPRTVNDASTTLNTAAPAGKTVTSATANFQASDVNAAIAGPNIRPNTHIVSVTNSTTAVMNNYATATATNTSLTITRSSGIATVDNIQITNGDVQVGADPGGAFNYTQLIPGQSGPLTVYATRTPEAEADNLHMDWQFDVTDVAGNTVTCEGTDPPPPPDPVGPPAGPTTGPPTLAVWDTWLDEGSSGTTTARFWVTRYGDTSAPTTISYETGTATATASDFTAVSATPLTFAATETHKQVSVNVNPDTLPEKAETFTVKLSGQPRGTVLGDSAATATIRNDDDAAYLAAENLVVAEGGLVTFNVKRSGNTTDTSTVIAKISGGTATAGSDYTLPAERTLTFGPNDASETVTVQTTADTAPEPNETLNLVLSKASVGTTLADTSASAYIDDDDGTTAAPATTFFSVDSLSLYEGNAVTPAVFTVRRYGNTSTAMTINYKTSGSATADVDYESVPALPARTLTFEAGATSKTVTVNVLGDTNSEKDETFNLQISGQPKGSALGDSSGTATIVNDDGSQYLGVFNLSQNEGSSSNAFNVTVTRWGNTSQAMTAAATIKTSGGTATAGTDYNGILDVPVNFAAGADRVTIPVTVNGDTAVEANETFNVSLTSPGLGVTSSDAAGTMTIVNDDAA